MLAFVLSRHDVREYDQLITLFTAERGKIEALARSVKKSTSKNSPALEPFALIEVELASGGESSLLTTAQVVESFRGLTTTLPGISVGQLIVSLVDSFAPINQPEPALAQFLVRTFRSLSTLNAIPPSAKDAVILALLGALGLAPEVTQCVAGGEILTDRTIGDFSVSDGGVRCTACKKSGLPGLPLSPQVWQFLQKSFEELLVEKISDAEARSLHALLYQFFVYHTGKKIGDWGSVLDKK